MNENKVIVWLYTLVTAVIAVLATVFRCILEKYYIEAETGMYKTGAATPEAFDVFMVVGVIVIIASLFLFRKESMPKGVYGLPVVTSAISVLAATALVFSAVTFLMGAKNDILAQSAGQIIYRIKYIGAFTAFPAGLYYFISVFSGKTPTKTLSVFSFFPLVWTWTYLLGVYFDHTAEMSSPLRIVQEMALIMLLLYQLMETRALLGKSDPVFYLMISGLASIFLSSAFLPVVFKWIGGELALNLENVYSLYGGLMAVYIFSRMVGYAVKCNGGHKEKPKKHRAGKNDIFSEEEEEEQPEQVVGIEAPVESAENNEKE